MIAGVAVLMGAPVVWLCGVFLFDAVSDRRHRRRLEKEWITELQAATRQLRAVCQALARHQS